MGVHGVKVKLASQSTRFFYSSLIVTPEEILAASKNAGYAARVFKVQEITTSSNHNSLALQSYGTKVLL